MLVDEIPMAQWQWCEQSYVAIFKAIGLKLTNTTPGGDGFGKGDQHPCYGIPVSAERKAKQAAKMRGKRYHLGFKHSSEARARMSEKHKGKTNSPETRAKLSLVLRGKKKSDHMRQALSASRKGMKFSESHRAAISKAVKLRPPFFAGKRHTAEAKAKMSAAKRGKKPWNYGKTGLPWKHSEEWRKAMSERQKGNKFALGYKHSPDEKRKISEAATEMWRKRKLAKQRSSANGHVEPAAPALEDPSSNFHPVVVQQPA